MANDIVLIERADQVPKGLIASSCNEVLFAQCSPIVSVSRSTPRTVYTVCTMTANVPMYGMYNYTCRFDRCNAYRRFRLSRHTHEKVTRGEFETEQWQLPRTAAEFLHVVNGQGLEARNGTVVFYVCRREPRSCSHVTQSIGFVNEQRRVGSTSFWAVPFIEI